MTTEEPNCLQQKFHQKQSHASENPPKDEILPKIVLANVLADAKMYAKANAHNTSKLHLAFLNKCD